MDYSTLAQGQINALYNAGDFKSVGNQFTSTTLGIAVYLIDRDNYTDHAREICAANDNPPPTRESINDWWKSEKKIKVGRSWYAVIELN
jgi:hypothetical protein